MNAKRNETRPVRVRGLVIGGGAPVSVQSMTNVPIEDVRGTIDQIERLREAGAELVRVALRNESSLDFLKNIRAAVDMPLSADVHFNHRIAIGAIEAGIDKVRINPGNIGDDAKVREVVRAASEHSVPIRIGVNGGSLDRSRYPELNAESLVASAMEHVRILEDNSFFDIVVSIKASDVRLTVEANRLFAATASYPLHIGLTEAGYGLSCVVHSSAAMGSLLLDGVGDTIRVSMTGDPVEEIAVARNILEAVGLRAAPVRVIACPTCKRTDPSLDLLSIAREVEDELLRRFGDMLARSGRGVVVAVMGCEVNGPGEAAHADAGIAGGRGGRMLLFARGRKTRRISADEAVGALADEVCRILEEGCE